MALVGLVLTYVEEPGLECAVIALPLLLKY